MQFRMFEDKRLARFTTPNHTVAINFSWAAANSMPVNFDYAEFILELLTKKKRQAKISYLGAPEVLTRIAYQAIGKADRLPHAPSQVIWLEGAAEEEVCVMQIAPRLRTKRRYEEELKAAKEAEAEREREARQAKGKKPMSSAQVEREERAQREA